jgi:CubicO group peptidase (beta-lactamase class C family)
MLELKDYPNIRAIHVSQASKIVFEYSQEIESKTQLFPVGCIFKSFLSVLLGIAIFEGKIGSIEDCVIDYVSHNKKYHNNWDKLKIMHASSKTTGIIWPSPKETLPANMGEVMKLNFESEPGSSFCYKPDPQIILYLLEDVYGTEITKLFETKLLLHFKNTSYQWDRENIEGLQVSIQLLDEMGQLLLNKGVINGIRLFSEEYYEQLTSKYSKGGFPEGVPYGLGWWIEEESNLPYFYASGFGGQYLIIIPHKKTTISILSDMDRPHTENKNIIRLFN